MLRSWLLIGLMSVCSFGAINRYWHVAADGTGGRDLGASWAADTAITLDTLGVSTLTAGDVIFVKGGTHTLHAAIDKSAMDGTAISPITIIGVKAGTTNVGSAVVESDFAADTSDRAYISTATYAFKVGDFYIIKNLNVAGDATNLVNIGANSQIDWCRITQTSTSSTARYMLSAGDGSIVARCEFIGAKSNGISILGGVRVKYNQFHNLKDATYGIGILISDRGTCIANNVFSGVTTAISYAATRNHDISNNVFFNCATGLSGSTGYSLSVNNNIFDSVSVAGVVSTTQTDCNWYLANHGSNARCNLMWSGVDTVTVYKDFLQTTGNPLFAVPRTDFSLQALSPALNTGINVNHLVVYP